MKYQNEEEFSQVNMFKAGMNNENYAKYFTGQSYLNFLTNPEIDPITLANVTFEPGCRNNWHTHTAKSGGGQVLICTAGEGWYQAKGCDPVELKEGSVVIIAANTKHWHGAKKDSWFSHIAFETPGIDTENVWHEEVSDEEYNQLVD